MTVVRPLLLRRVAHLATFDEVRSEQSGVDVLCEGGTISGIGMDLVAPPDAEVIDASELLVLPGLINAHQHLYQVGLRAIPHLERALIGPWLGGLGARCLDWWDSGHFTPELIGSLAACGLAESLLGGVTTVADQHYLHPAGATQSFIEATIDAAGSLGVRLHAGRGTLTLGRDQGGSADPRLVQSVSEVLRHSEALIEQFHDPTPGAMVRIDLAPCGVHVDAPELFEAFADLADTHSGVRLHTHLYEAVDTAFSQERYGITPWQFLQRHGWDTDSSWVAHVVDIPHHEIAELAAAGVSVAHLPAPDLRMGWGCAPLREFLDAGVTVGFGTTGSASNDGANLLGDLRVAALAHRHSEPDPQRWPTIRELLETATRGSAACLGRPELGRIEVGAAADLAAWDLGTVDRVGIEDPVAGLVTTGLSDRANTVVVGGTVVVRSGALTMADERELARRATSLLAQASNHRSIPTRLDTLS